MVQLTLEQARRFILVKQGLLGDKRLAGKSGALSFIRSAGCLQFDPIDVCGRNAEIVLHARVEGFKKSMLNELLYTDRLLFDFPDKNLAILPIELWPYFERFRHAGRENIQSYPEMDDKIAVLRDYIEKYGAICSDDVSLDGEISWQSAIHWSDSRKVSRSVLEQMYSSGDLVIKNKNGTRKYYDLSERHVPSDILAAVDPLPDEHHHKSWRILRRIAAVGLLWNRSSDAWLNIWGLKSAERNLIFTELLEAREIIKIGVSGISEPLFCLAADKPLLEQICVEEQFALRCELIAPLDNMLWDRRLIQVLFGFYYTWEIYTPPEKRRYGHYTLPMLYGDSFAGRIEARANKKVKILEINAIWLEPGFVTHTDFELALEKCLMRFAEFNGCEEYKKL